MAAPSGPRARPSAPRIGWPTNCSRRPRRCWRSRSAVAWRWGIDCAPSSGCRARMRPRMRTSCCRPVRSGRNPGEECRRMEAEVHLAVQLEDAFQRQVPEEVPPKLAQAVLAPPGAGRHEVTVADIEAVQRGLLFNGAVEACAGNSHI